MTSLQSLTTALQELLTTTADRLARSSGLIRRQRKVTGSNFAQTLVFTWMGDPRASESRMLPTAVTLGLNVSRQGFCKRFTPRAAEFLRQLLQQATHTLVAADPVAIPLLQRFAAVNVLDSSTVALPEQLISVYRGGRSGTTDGDTAALKLTLSLDLKTGSLFGPELCAGRDGDLLAPLAQRDPPTRGLQLADLGYFSLNKFARWSRQGVYWLSRFTSGTVIRNAQGRRLDLHRLLQAAQSDVDVEVVLGGEEKVKCRLIARRVPAEVAELRRARLKKKSERRGDRPSPVSLALADWNILVTNLPRKLMSVTEAIALYRLRWQIELVFKLWKSQGGLTHWRGKDPWRILCEIYGKLIAMIVQHWTLVVGGWSRTDRSPTKAARVLAALALSMAHAFASTSRLRAVLAHAAQMIQTACRMERRRKSPNANDMILSLCRGP
jgi:Transposase DDE domain